MNQPPDLDKVRADIHRHAGPDPGRLAAIAYWLVNQLEDANNDRAGMAATIRILRGQTGHTSAPGREYTIGGAADDSARDAAEINALLDTQLSELEAAFTALAADLARRHTRDLDTDPPGLACVRPCGACQLLAIVPAGILAAAGITPPPTPPTFIDEPAEGRATRTRRGSSRLGRHRHTDTNGATR